MAEPRLKYGNLAWAPRALAVISCALALLALQPAAQGVGGGTPGAISKTRAIALRDGDAAFASPDIATRRAPAMAARSRSPRDGRVEVALLASAGRLHILATMEILHRLLIGELQPPERHILPLVWFQPLCLLELSSAAVQRPRPAGDGFTPPPITERAFAIEHCLLAPPVA